MEQCHKMSHEESKGCKMDQKRVTYYLNGPLPGIEVSPLEKMSSSFPLKIVKTSSKVKKLERPVMMGLAATIRFSRLLPSTF